MQHSMFLLCIGFCLYTFAISPSSNSNHSACTFVCSQREPAILRGLDIGECSTKWTVDYLAKAGGDRDVKIHVSSTPQMDFINKNFAYK